MKAALYARVSTQDQREASLGDQFRKCEELCAREGLSIVQRFSDFGLSGNETNRPQYQALLTAVRARKFDVIVADEVSRLWRNEGEQAQRVEELQFLGAHVLTCDGIDTRREGFEMLLAVKGAMSKMEVKITGRRIHRTLDGLVRQGKNAGGKTFGYRPVPLFDPVRTDAYGRPLVIGARREVVREQAAIVLEIFEQYASGWSPRKIAEGLNARGIPSPGSTWQRTIRRKDGKWLASTIGGDPKRGIGILNNELYVGRYVWNRSAGKKKPGSAKRAHRRRPEGEHVIAQVPELRIVPQVLWDEVKARQNRQSRDLGDAVKRGLRKATSGRGPKYLFSGLLKCGVCGANFCVTGASQSYTCASHTNGGKQACTNGFRVVRAVVEDKLLKAISEELGSEEYLREFQRETRRILRERQARSDQGRSAREAKLRQLKSEVGNLVDAIAAGKLVVSPALSAKLASTEAELAALEDGAGAEEAELAKIVQLLPQAGARFRALIRNLPKALNRGDVARGRATLQRLLGGGAILSPNPVRRRLVARIGLDPGALLGVSGYRNIIVVAGVGFEPTTFGL
jgi:site-specific DNA recombinase